MKSDKAALLLEDGTVFEGRAFGKVGKATGETVFYTGVVGYQEVVTDPSYRGTLVVCTYPIIGSYGVNSEDNESPAVHVSGIVIKEYSPHFSNFRADGAFEDFLKEHKVVGIRGVDTRAVAVHLRDHGEKKGIIASGRFDKKALLKKLGKAPSSFESDLVKDLPSNEALKPNGSNGRKVVALDVGAKRSLLAQLAQLGCAVTILPPAASPDDILAETPGALIIAGGPGDPRIPEYAVETVKSVLGKLPIFGVGLGHQLLALSLGCGIKRMKAGHRGVNHPVRDVVNQACHITVQHHSFAVDEKSVPDDVEATHVNVNDKTIEGIRSKKFPASSVQFHPSPDEMGKPNRLLEEFVVGA